ncbi:MAG: hypothetical protein KGJ06_01625 [Pseudomonadota bacterium]|nr:hypothetical protein [Pseudomonadota bacterium]
MSRILALAYVEKNPFAAAGDSLKNLAHLILDFMYGTPERARFTCAFAIGIAVLGFMLDSAASSALQVCPVR